LKDGAVLHGQDGREGRIGGIFALAGDKQIKRNVAGAGDLVALARLEPFATGEMLSTAKSPAIMTGSGHAKIEQLTPVYRFAVAVKDRKDEVKLTGAIAKLCEEDPSLLFEQNPETHDMILAGQGEVHLKVAAARLASRYGLNLVTRAPRVPYRETIRKTAAARGRHKRQTGGHGQFGDVLLEIAPSPRGAGFVFHDRIKGGVVPRQWIGSVEKGVHDYMKSGPLGFPVVDISVALTDGSYHAVDSSDAAFQTAGRLAMSEGMPDCAPVLLEPARLARLGHGPLRDAAVGSLRPDRGPALPDARGGNL
jgi:elongation factor G